ncbi:MAG TPA: hypothetical protein VHB21_08175 [Minicystis sp.]|nr:hypothetical protein [Minicystis sp.]
MADSQCANTYGHFGTDLYCEVTGWQRLPMPPGSQGVICGPGETCAEHGTSDCRHVCCDLKTDPDCGVPLKQQCCGQC